MTSSSWWNTRQDQPVEHGRPSGIPEATSRSPSPSRSSTIARRFCRSTARRDPSRPGRRWTKLFGYQNSRKAREGGPEGLEGRLGSWHASATPRRRFESGSRPTRAQAAYGTAWDKIAAAHPGLDEDRQAVQLPRAGICVRLGPLPDRSDLGFASPRNRRNRTPTGSENTPVRDRVAPTPALFPTPPSTRVREAKLADSLAFWKKLMGDTEPMVARVLRGRTPKRAAKDYVRGTKLADVSVRHALAKGGLKALFEFDDADHRRPGGRRRLPSAPDSV